MITSLLDNRTQAVEKSNRYRNIGFLSTVQARLKLSALLTGAALLTISGTDIIHAATVPLAPPMQLAPAKQASDLETTVILQWKSVVGSVARYEWEIYENQNPYVKFQGTTRGNRDSAEVLPATTYRWRVRARGDRLVDTVPILGTWSSFQYFSTAPRDVGPTLKSPADGTFSSPGAYGAKLIYQSVYWNALPEAGDYEVCYGFAPDEVNVQRITTSVKSLPANWAPSPSSGGVTSSASIQNSPISPEYYPIHTYDDQITYWKMRAVGNTGIRGPWSEEWAFGNIPNAPTLYLPADGVFEQTTSPLLVWSPAKNARGYIVSYCEGHYGNRNWQNITVYGRSTQLPTLKRNTWYTWRVQPAIQDALGINSLGPISGARTFLTP